MLAVPQLSSWEERTNSALNRQIPQGSSGLRKAPSVASALELLFGFEMFQGLQPVLFIKPAVVPNRSAYGLFPSPRAADRTVSWVTEETETAMPRYYSMNFKYEKLVEEGQEDNKDDHLHKWKTDALGQQGCRNFERLCLNQSPCGSMCSPRL